MWVFSILQWTKSHRNIKLKLSRYTLWRCLGERRYSSYSFSTSELDGGEWSASRLGRALAPEKEPSVPIVQEAGWAAEPVRTQTLEKKSLRLYWELILDRPARIQTLSDWATRLFTSRYSYSNWCLRWACFQKTVFRCSAAFLSKNLKCSSVLAFMHDAWNLNAETYFPASYCHLRVCSSRLHIVLTLL
jgi:hypothetical protein